MTPDPNNSELKPFTCWQRFKLAMRWNHRGAARRMLVGNFTGAIGNIIRGVVCIPVSVIVAIYSLILYPIWWAFTGDDKAAAMLANILNNPKNRHE